MSTMYSIGQMNQLGDALEAAEFTPDDVTKLKSFKNLRAIKDVLKGHAQIVKVKQVIDLDADPFVPDGWQVVEHQKQGEFEWDPAEVSLYLSNEQQGNIYIEGNKLREELKNQKVFNTNLLDYLLSHRELIPEEWKDKYILFWGTIYRHPGGFLCVRYLRWGGGRWDWRYRWLGLRWRSNVPAAVLASN